MTTSTYTMYRKEYLREWRQWYQMHARCNNKIDYCQNIIVEPEWCGQQGFINFVDDIGPRPSDDHCLFRVDKSLNYGPTSTKWATRNEDWHRRDITNIRIHARTLHKYRKGYPNANN